MLYSVKCLFPINWDDHVGFSFPFVLLMCSVTSVGFLMLNHLCSWDKSQLVLTNNPFNTVGFYLLIYSWGFCIYITKDIGLQFSCDVFIWLCYQSNSVKCFFLLSRKGEVFNTYSISLLVTVLLRFYISSWISLDICMF